MSIKQAPLHAVPQQVMPPVARKPDVNTQEAFIKLYEEEKKPVRGKFIFHELPGGKLDFMFRKYRDDQLTKYEMSDGQVYTIPLMVARHLNTNCSYPSYSYKSDENGRPKVSIAEKIRRCSFQSLEFVEQEMTSASTYSHSALPTA